MIIVSQDKTKIINFNNVEEIKIVKIVDKNHEIKKLQIVALGQYEYELGDYKTEERAKEILEQIRRIYRCTESFKHSKDPKIQERICEKMNEMNIYTSCYEMPIDE